MVENNLNISGELHIVPENGRASFGVMEIKQVTDKVEKLCVLIAAAGFGQKAENPNFQKDVADHVRSGRLFLGFSEETPVTFRILQEKPNNCVYLAGAAKIPGSRPHIVTDMTKYILNQLRPDTVVTRTGSDIVLEEMLNLSNSVAPFDSRVDERSMEIIEACGLRNEKLRRETLVIPEYYGGQPMLNPELGRPKSKNPAVAKFMRSAISDEEYFRGAAIILIGERKMYPRQT